MLRSKNNEIKGFRVSLILCIGLLFGMQVHAEVECGPPLIDVRIEKNSIDNDYTIFENGLTIKVNDGFIDYEIDGWQMSAPEDVPTRFSITQLGDSRIALALTPSAFVNNDPELTWQKSGISPIRFIDSNESSRQFGETTFIFSWFYPPNEASGECKVTIRVIKAERNDVTLPLVLGLTKNGEKKPTNQANGLTFKLGDKLQLLASGTPQPDSPKTVDAYLFVREPGGMRFFVSEKGEFTTEVVPYVRNLPLGKFKDAAIFSYLFTGIEPVGYYEWGAVLTEPGTTKVVNNGLGEDFIGFNYKILAAYVLFGQSEDSSTVAIARVIVDGVNSECPTLQSVSDSQFEKISMSLRINPDPMHFPISVCEAIYPLNMAMTVTGSKFTLPKVNTDIKNVAIFGDSGCKPSDQSCEEPSTTWPFADLANKAASGGVDSATDLVLHMGDYNYRGTPDTINIVGFPDEVTVYDAGDNATQGLCQNPGGYFGQNSPGSLSPDNWVDWQADFFTPAKTLLEAAPWIFARGNHELCSRAGTGWFYLLDSNSKLLGGYAKQLSCPKTDNDQSLIFSPPYLVNLGLLDIVVLDSANACDSGLLHSDSYVNQFNLIRGLIGNSGIAQQTWVQTHRPLWGVEQLDTIGVCGSQNSDKYCFVNQTLQYADNQSPLPESVNLVVSGHMHRFQAVSFLESHPDQLIVGNSGVKLANTFPKETTQLTIDGDEAIVTGVSDFGYMSISINKSHWTGNLIGTSSTSLPIVSCDSQKFPICIKNAR